MIRLKTKKKEVLGLAIMALLIAFIMLSFGISFATRSNTALADGPIFTMSGNTLTGVNGTLSGEITEDYIFQNNGGVVVETIGSNAFSGQTNMTEITIPRTVTKINSGAFQNCSNLQTVNLKSSTRLNKYPLEVSSGNGTYPYKLDQFGHYVEDENGNFETDYTQGYWLIGSGSFAKYEFYNQKDEEWEANTVYTLFFQTDMPNSDAYTMTVSIGIGSNTIMSTSSFSLGTYLEKRVTFTMPYSSSGKLWVRFELTNAPSSGSTCRIYDYSIEKGVTNIAVNAFRGCPNLVSAGLAFDEIKENGVTVAYRANNFLSDLNRDGNALFIPSSHNGLPVTKVKGSFEDANNIFTLGLDLLKLVATMQLKWVFMQGNITSLGIGAFYLATSLMTVDMQQTSIQTIPESAFQLLNPDLNGNFGHNLQVDNPYSPHSLEEGGRILDIAFPSTLTTIKDNAFCCTSLTTASRLPDSVTTIGNNAFKSAVMLSFRFPNSLTTIGQGAFQNSNISILNNTNVGIVSIGEDAFANAHIYSFDHLPESVKYVYDNAFNGATIPANFVALKNNLEYIGAGAFANTDISSIIIRDTDASSSFKPSIGQKAFQNCSNLTIYTTAPSIRTVWNSNWNFSARPVVWSCSLQDEEYVVSFVKRASNPSKNPISDPVCDGYSFRGWNTASDGSGTMYTSADISSVSNGTTLYSQWSKQSCVAEGTLITLADGSQVAVEDLTGEEYLLVWNMLTGEYDAAPMIFIDSDPCTTYEIIELTFSDNTQVKVIDEHAFFDMTLGEYVFLRSDAAQYIGHYFNKQGANGAWESVQLVSVNIYNEVTTAWSPVTFGHLCFYVNGMLSMPGATEGLINIFDVDTALMTFDEDQMAEDIATYGLFTYEEFSSIIPLPELVFEAFGGQYLKVSIGKGLITFDEIIERLNRYADFFE